ncbi:MAG: hypothetical protein AAFV36_08930 [Myxococcota bacterium]
MSISEGEALKVIDEALSSLDQDAQARIMAWANQKFLGAAPAVAAPAGVAAPAPSAPAAKKAEKKPSTRSSKPKPVLKVDKDINLFPEGKKSCNEFVEEKSPTNAKQKGVIAIYYVREILEYEKVTTSHVAAFFKAVGWAMPSNLPNTLQQAGTEGWLDTADAEDLKITSQGENLVEHRLPGNKAV